MALKYATIAQYNEYLGTSGVDTFITSLGEAAEAIFDGLIGSTGIESKSYTTYYQPGYSANSYEEGRVFSLRALNITAITTVNGSSPGTVNVDYTVDLQRLELKTAVSLPTTFPYRYTVVYVAGWATIPADVRLVCLKLAAALKATQTSEGIASFRQDLLAVNYKSESILDTLVDPATKWFIQLTAGKYTLPYLVA